jgi:hypothetical protein
MEEFSALFLLTLKQQMGEMMAEKMRWILSPRSWLHDPRNEENDE